jgi:hypothetical protein
MDPTTRYLRYGAKRVAGWLNPFSATFIAWLSLVQRDDGITGSVGEVGVHHGRLFILMQASAAPEEAAVAIDVFGDQHLNTDRSGSGDRAIFERNVAKWGGPAPLTVVQKSSLDMTPAEYLTQAQQPARLFSVDGGHTAECAESDMRLADAVLHPEGVVIVDDIYNEFWPDVAVGVGAYCRDPTARLRPFAITPGKVYFCRSEQAARYLNETRTFFNVEFDKMTTMFGRDVAVFGVELTFAKAMGPLHLLRHRLSRSTLGPTLRRWKAGLSGQAVSA